MASLSTAASLVAGAAATPSASRRRLVAVKASAGHESQATPKPVEAVQATSANSSSKRRAVMFAAAAAAVTAVASRGGDAAFADEPKPGSPEAKKKYGPICITMPTARICHN